jgi:hypothetical protein
MVAVRRMKALHSTAALIGYAVCLALAAHVGWIRMQCRR